MTKADIVNEISRTTGIEKAAVQTTVEAFMEAIKGSVIDGKNVYRMLRQLVRNGWILML